LRRSQFEGERMDSGSLVIIALVIVVALVPAVALLGR
jgi:hypothetical protein